MDKKNSEERRLSSGRHRKNIRKDVRKFTSFGFLQKKLTQKSDVSFWFSVNMFLFTIPKNYLKQAWNLSPMSRMAFV